MSVKTLRSIAELWIADEPVDVSCTIDCLSRGTEKVTQSMPYRLTGNVLPAKELIIQVLYLDCLLSSYSNPGLICVSH